MFLERERELRWGGFIKGLVSTGDLGRICSGQKIVIQPSSRKLGVQQGGSGSFLPAVPLAAAPRPTGGAGSLKEAGKR